MDKELILKIIKKANKKYAVKANFWEFKNKKKYQKFDALWERTNEIINQLEKELNEPR